MRTMLFLCVFATAATSAAQDKGKCAGFTRSPTEHIINELEQPFEVRSVSGLLTRGDANELKGVLIEIKGPGDHNQIRSAETNEKGQFKIRHVPIGTYRFKATLNGFQSVVGTIVVSKKSAKHSSIKIVMLIGV